MINNLQTNKQTQTVEVQHTQPVPESENVQFIVPRTEGFSLSTLAIISATVDNPKLKNEQDFLLALKRGVTFWINNSTTGRRAWKETAEDFNVGDLAQHLNEELTGILHQQGISELNVEIMGATRGNWNFDTILANYELIEDEDTEEN